MKKPCFILTLAILFLCQLLPPLPVARAEGMAALPLAAVPLLKPPDCSWQAPLLPASEVDKRIGQIQEQMKVSPPRDPDALYDEADYLLDQEKYREAIPLFTTILEIQQDYPGALASRGYAYAHIGQWDRAFADVNANLAKHPSSAKAYYNRANVYLVKKDYEQAVVDFKKSLVLDPTDKCAHNNIGIAYEGLGKPASAIAHYSRAIEIDPGFRKALQNRADLYYQKKYYYEAFIDNVRLTWLSLRGK